MNLKVLLLTLGCATRNVSSGSLDIRPTFVSFVYTRKATVRSTESFREGRIVAIDGNNRDDRKQSAFISGILERVNFQNVATILGGNTRNRASTEISTSVFENRKEQ